MTPMFSRTPTKKNDGIQSMWIEAQTLAAPGTGIGQYARGLIDAMIRSDRDHLYDLSYFDFLPNAIRYRARRRLHLPIINTPPNARIRKHRWIPYALLSSWVHKNWFPPIDTIFGRHDIFLFPNIMCWPVRVGKTAVIVYDIYPIDHPEFTPPDILNRFQKELKTSLENATVIITISNFSADRIRHHYPFASEKIVVAYADIDRSVYHKRTTAEQDFFRTRLNLPEKFFLYTGTIEPRKNVDGLIEAWMTLNKKERQEIPLVLTGNVSILSHEISRRIHALQEIGEPIMHLGYVEQKDIPLLVASATALVYPSHYEGFGIPILEAYASGVPVLTSATTSTGEIAGDAAILVDPRDLVSLRSGLEKIGWDASTRQGLISRGFHRLQFFSWKKSASLVLEKCWGTVSTGQ